MKLSTTLPGATLIFGAEGAPFIMWGNSAWYNPIAKEIGFIGKRDGSVPCHWLVYNEAANTWSNDRAVWSTSNTLGHGYDQNTIDPATGDVYFRDWDGNIQKYNNGSWSQITGPSPANVVGGLSWFQGVGLCYNDGRGLKKYSGGSWSSLQTLSGDSYHDWSEYNPTANVLIFGGGNSSTHYKCTAAESVSSIADPPFNLGGASSQGPAISVPNQDKLIAWSQDDGDWAEYDISADAWSTLTQSSGDGSSPQTGTPNLTAGINNSVIACPVDAYGVQVWIQYTGSGSNAAVWVYKH